MSELGRPDTYVVLGCFVGPYI